MLFLSGQELGNDVHSELLFNMVLEFLVSAIR